jgi:hypothetical protein
MLRPSEGAIPRNVLFPRLSNVCAEPRRPSATASTPMMNAVGSSACSASQIYRLDATTYFSLASLIPSAIF